MTPDEIPTELLEILNDQAGKVHRRDGSAVRCLAEILTKYDELRTIPRKYLMLAGGCGALVSAAIISMIVNKTFRDSWSFWR